MTRSLTSSASRVSLGDSFWGEFWERTRGGTVPAVFKLGAAASLFRASQMLALGRAILDANELSINVDGQLVAETSLPEEPDFHDTDSFEAFVTRVCNTMQASSLTFTRDYCLSYDGDFAAKVRSFIDGYVNRAGLPTPGVNAVFIAGHYKETWIGLHNDFCNTFLVPVHGRKKVMFWPPDFFDDAADLEVQYSFNGLCFGKVDVSVYADHSITLDAGPGDVLFIPEKWWHYNNLEEPETTLSLSVGVFSNGAVADSVKGAVSAALSMPVALERATPWDRPAPGYVQGIRSVELPPQLDQLLQAIGDSMRLQVLKLASSNGVVTAAADVIRPPADLDETCVVRGRADSPVFLVEMHGGAGLLLAQGKMARVPAARPFYDLVEAVTKGGPFVCGSLSSWIDVKSWVNWLYCHGALELVDPTS